MRLAALAAVPAAVAAGAVAGGVGALVLAGVALVLLVLLAGGSVGGLIAALLVAEPLAEVLKRLTFVLGEGSMAAYYGVQLLPTLLLAAALAAALPRLRMPPPALWLLALVAWVSLCTLLSPVGAPWFQRLGALHQEIVPALLFLAALAVRDRAAIGRAAAAVCVASALYGLWQGLAGYTALDFAWAVGAAERSIQAGKVFAWMVGDSWERRIFSLFADPFTWGQALVGALVLVHLARLPRGWTALAWAAALVGLVLTQSRTPWAALAVTGAAWALLALPAFRRPWLVLAAAVLGFPLTLWLGSAAYDLWFTGAPAADDPFLRRWLTVGTIEARLDAWTALLDVLRAHPLTGVGAGADPRYAADLPLAPEIAAAHYAHNVLVTLALYGGAPAVLLFLAFQGSLLRLILPRGGAEGRLAAAFLLGSQAAGYLNAGIFLTWQYFLALGLVAGAAVAQTRPAVVASPHDGIQAHQEIAA